MRTCFHFILTAPHEIRGTCLKDHLITSRKIIVEFIKCTNQLMNCMDIVWILYVKNMDNLGLVLSKGYTFFPVQRPMSKQIPYMAVYVLLLPVTFVESPTERKYKP